MADQNAVPNITETGKQDLGGKPAANSAGTVNSPSVTVSTTDKTKLYPVIGAGVGALIAWQTGGTTNKYLMYIGGGIVAGLLVRKYWK